jgi:hypothetical protein
MDEKILKDAQYRKGASIAWFNATNASIELVKSFKIEDNTIIKIAIKEWRDWFIEEYKTYYATVIANIGINYVAKDTIEKIKNTKTIDELRSVWLSLSEDERRDGEILKVKDEVKQSYEKI